MGFLSRTARFWIWLEVVGLVLVALAVGNADNPGWVRAGGLALWLALGVVTLVAVFQREKRRNGDGAYWVKILLIGGPWGRLAWLRHDDRAADPDRPQPAAS